MCYHNDMMMILISIFIAFVREYQKLRLNTVGNSTLKFLGLVYTLENGTVFVLCVGFHLGLSSSSFFCYLTGAFHGSSLYSGNLSMVELCPFLPGADGLKGAS